MSDIEKRDDIYDNQALAELSRRKKKHLALAVEVSGLGLWDWEVQTGKVEFNERWAQIIGYTLKELEPLSIDTWIRFAHPVDLEKSNQLLKKCFSHEFSLYECEVRMKHKEGHWIWVLDRGKVVEWDKDGTPIRMTGAHIDITNLKQTQQALKESEQNLRMIFNNTHDAIFVHTVDGRILDTNQKMLELYRVSKEQALQSTIAKDFSTSDNPISQLNDLWNRVVQGEPATFEWKARRPNDGSSFDVEVALKRIILSNHAVILANIRDITSQKAAEMALKESEEKFRALVENSTDAIMRFDRQHRHLYVNPIAEKETGIPAEKFIGKTHEELDFPNHLCSLWKQVIDQVFYSGKINRIEFQLPNGLWIDWMIIPELDESGHVKTVFTSSRDITERKKAEKERAKLEEQLRQTQKIEAVGQLAGGIAHDFNNMLGIILGHVDMAMEQMNPDQNISKNLREIKKAAQSSADLTQQLLGFARKQTIDPKVLDLNETVEAMLKMLRRLIGENIDLAWFPLAGLWSVKLDTSQINQILANLCLNARDAINGLGKITIETRNVIIDDAYCDNHPESVPGDFVMLAVSDNGCGMDKKIMGKIFEPFFTTKELGCGTGLGLATIYGIVKQNKGFINVYSEPEKETTFKIYLPRFAGKKDHLSSGSASKAITGGKETILLVEDEPGILIMTSMMLERLGYTVLKASAPGEAIRQARNYTGKIHLLITDVVMPEMNGRDLAKDLILIFPEIRYLFMSGYTANVIAHNGMLDEDLYFIQKPFSVSDLAAKVRQAIEENKE